MSVEDNSARFKLIADQLKCPTGDAGLETASHMAENNHNMILQTIAEMKLREYDTILEIGPGGGHHVSALFNEIGNLDYYGVDISQLMIDEATRVNQSLFRVGNLSFSLSDGQTIDFSANFFDKIFTVNTLYFWKDPAGYTQEILRVLKFGGLFYLAFATKDFMEKLPFTQYGFQLYDIRDAEELLVNNGFKIADVVRRTEKVKLSAELNADREFIILVAQKAS